MTFNEDSRVKIPTILHLCRLGYSYISLKNSKWDETSNIFPELFKESISRINSDKDLTENDLKRILDEIALSLDNDDLGRAFYEKLIDQSEIRLIDFANFNNNTFHVVTELTYKNEDEEFRPDITLLINGMPLVFIEVKKPNNKDGIQAEFDRIQKRTQNKKFKNFLNITQLMIFSNNMEYAENTSHKQIEGAFYATTSQKNVILNYFREEEKFNLKEILAPTNAEIENFVLKDTNYVGIKNSQEFVINKDPNSPTNRICTSILQRERLAFLLRYGFAYMKENSGLQKHVMRYPQFFATKAIQTKLDEGIRKGIIWHTQGSGKTALTYYNAKYLTDYFQSRNIIPKFYFIVDRLDLLIQASKEFRGRGLVVHEINSRNDFVKDIKTTSVIHNDSGKSEITVVNIQKFKEDSDVLRNTDYNLNIQRIYFLDEVHRSYNPKGSFLANLRESDPNAIHIGLTGTPLLSSDFNSRDLFGEYIHKYYYNASIADGYTLKLIREEIETKYKLSMKKALEEVDILKGEGNRKTVYAHQSFVEPMLDFIIEDFTKARITHGDNTIGGMVICDSAEQAEKLYEIFQHKYLVKKESEKTTSDTNSKLIESASHNIKNYFPLSASVILHDIGTKQEREAEIEAFKDGKIDILFVYNMLLTGFDAPRLKKLYLGRLIKKHNLLQALTRVNRPYKNFRYGYIVDFADIEEEFNQTNRDYLKELNEELGDEKEHYSNLFKTPEEIQKDIQDIKELLFHFDTDNAEIFSQQISQINDRSEMLKITKALNTARELYNLIRLSRNYELLDKLDFQKLTLLSREANNHLAIINAREALENNDESTNLLNFALEDVIFAFLKVKEEEMILADQLRNTLKRTREMLGGNFDQRDPVFISLKQELERLFKKKNLNEVTKEDMEANIKALNAVYDEARELERKNQLLRAKYDNDEKYARIHKRLMEKDPLTESEAKLFELLSSLKKEVDTQILQNDKMLENESFVEKMLLRLVIDQIKNKHKMSLDLATSKRINHLIVNEYRNEYLGKAA
ncbi:type I restriction endonuclease subunit R [Leptospira mtsangambouensis]|uniref:type I restriction endonuclease subunit R n=1 Tax=Leptospira mtsangambouensis TaxID=2484912 RepID=UPI001EE9B4A0|nr:type I restriction endonuclease [Leptospira mtsangambouensis]MCG6141355.1 DEAD/DEAH box helicase family protein [Leptospira mtsangambouensis]